MRLKTHALLLCLLSFAPACGPRASRAPTQPAPTTQASQPTAAATMPVPKSATCALLSGADIREVQGEEPTDAQGSEHLSGGLRMSQCFYRLPTFNQSVSIEVVRASADAQGPVKDYWRQKFHSDAGESRERERERREREREEELKRENANGQVREGGHTEREREGEEETRARRVAGIGDEAYWSGGVEGGALYVLKKDSVISVSVGGTEDEAGKIRKAKALAEKVLKHF
ncbi:MAG: hypothetical protein M3444_06420 [Acidobacteriota bacterium]|nr:hypothetical protein [Acidobacteriota bacterium]MDQ5839280.1 hypothetical protein [Acidobacteriota bacterium]